MNVLPQIQKNHASQMTDLINLYTEAVMARLPDVVLGTLETMIRDHRVLLERKRVLAAAYPEQHIVNAATKLEQDRAAHLRRLRMLSDKLNDINTSSSSSFLPNTGTVSFQHLLQRKLKDLATSQTKNLKE